MRYSWKNKGEGVTDNLGKQFQKVVRCCNQGSYETRHTYIKSMERFLNHVGPEFKLQKIQNIKDTHLKSYAESLKNAGNKDSYIKKELAGIRFFHNQTNSTKYELSDSNKFNKEFFEKEEKSYTNRSWTEKEIENFKEVAEKLGREDFVKMCDVCTKLGLRSDEAATLKNIQVEKALEQNKLQLKNTKGGRPRTIYLNFEQRKCLEDLKRDPAGEKYTIVPEKFVENREIHKFKNQLRDFVYRHQDKIKEPERETNCTVHGWRHTAAQNLDKRLQEKGYSAERAGKSVSEYLGHGENRPDITNVYLNR